MRVVVQGLLLQIRGQGYRGRWFARDQYRPGGTGRLGMYLSSCSYSSSPSGSSSSGALPESIREILAGAGAAGESAQVMQRVQVNGWVFKSTNTKHGVFVEVKDGSTQEGIQVVLPRGEDEAGRRKIPAGTCVRVDGVLQGRPEGSVGKGPGKSGLYEVIGEAVQVLGEVDHGGGKYPLSGKTHSLEQLRSALHLRARSQSSRAVMRIRSALQLHLNVFYQQVAGFFQIPAPVLTTIDCEGAGDMFEVWNRVPAEEKEGLEGLKGKESSLVLRSDDGKSTYTAPFRVPTYLSVSGQLHAETFAAGMGRVYTFGPIFRAENSQTRRHLSEFYMLEAELSFTRGKEDVMGVLEDSLKYSARHVLKEREEDLQFLSGLTKVDLVKRIEDFCKCEFERITYTDAVDILREVSPTSNLSWGDDLSSEHEQSLISHFNKPVFVTDYPAVQRPFYMRVNTESEGSVEQNRITVSNFDLLLPEVLEAAGGSVREERLDVLLESMQRHGMGHTNKKGVFKEDPKYTFYTDLRRFGSCPHGGFGIGFERIVMYVTGMDNIRDVVPYPRHGRICYH
eukprot:Nk52_evm65s208 gene=Nk52_evmTU65s208